MLAPHTRLPVLWIATLADQALPERALDLAARPRPSPHHSDGGFVVHTSFCFIKPRTLHDLLSALVGRIFDSPIFDSHVVPTLSKGIEIDLEK